MVLFTSQRPLERAENIKTVYDAYNGPKKFVQLNWYRQSPEIHEHKIMVTDEIPADSGGSVIFIPHGMEGTKTYGLDQPRRYATQEECAFITYAVCQSEKTVPLMARQLGMSPENVLPLGMPRTDRYKKKLEHDKRVYLYAPTFGSEQNIDWSLIDSLLGDDEVLIVKPHMLSGQLVWDEYKHIFPASSEEPSEPYLTSCNVLITDYSSIMLDGLFLRTPVVLFTKDEDYLYRRGMYYDYPKAYSSYFTNNERDLVDYLRSARWVDEEKRDFFCGACDGNSTERVLDLIRRVYYENTYCSANI